MSNFRVLRRDGACDAFKVIDRRVPGEGTLPPYEQFRDALEVVVAQRGQTSSHAAEAQQGYYLVQNLETSEVRHFRVRIEPNIVEI
jgi:hypothetical protein